MTIIGPVDEPETDGALLARLGTDGVLWAAELAEKTGGILDPTPGGTLHAWLCNAIEAGRSAGYSAARARLRERGEL